MTSKLGLQTSTIPSTTYYSGRSRALAVYPIRSPPLPARHPSGATVVVVWEVAQEEERNVEGLPMAAVSESQRYQVMKG